MKKKIIALALAVTTLVLAVAGGTLAYLTDTSSSVNVATMGNVKVEQHEYQRAEGVKHTGTLKEGDLVPFEQGQPLYPAYAVDSTAYTAEPTNLLSWGEYVTAEGAGNGLWNDEKLFGAMDKFVFVENTGKSDAYYRTWIALECPEGMEFSEGADKEFMMNVNGHRFFDWEDVGYAVIDGQRYHIECATYTEKLAPGEISRPSLLQVVMTHNVNNDDVAKIGDTYEILSFTQAVQVDNMPSAEAALVAAFKEVKAENIPWNATDYEMEYPTVVTNAEELTETLAAAGAAGAGDSTIYIAADIDMTDVEWTPIEVDGYHGAGIVTVEGQGHTIKGLTAPLFHGGFAGDSGIVIKDLTIADSEIVSDNTQGAGAFIECVDSMETITLDNCHLINSSVYAPEARTGGLVGWTSGYSNQNDGPVKTYVNITNCSVMDCEITGTAVGGINGHAGASDWTYTTIDNCTVVGNTLVSTDDGDWRVGSIIGTANVGEVTISNITHGNNTLKQDNASSGTNYDKNKFVGRFVPGSTGKLVIDEEAVKTAVSDTASLKDALADTNTDYIVIFDNITVPGTNPDTNGYGATGINMTSGQTLDGAGKEFGANVWSTWDSAINITSGTIKNITINKGFRGIFINHNGTPGHVTLENVIIDGPTYTISCDQGTGYGLTATNCTFNGWTSYAATIGDVKFENCNFGYGAGYSYSRPYAPTEYVNCEFDADHFISVQADITFENCTFGGVLITADNVDELVSNTAKVTIK